MYPGNRRFLPKNDAERTNCRSYSSQAADTDEPPEIKTVKFVDQANKEYDAATVAAVRTSLVQKKGCKGAYSLRRASSHDRILATPVDPMHLVKDIVEHVVNLIVGREDSIKVRKQEEACKRFPSAWIKGKQGTLPKAPFTLSKDEIALADERAKSICVPTGFDWRPRPIFGKSSGMNLTSGSRWPQMVFLKFCLRNMLAHNQRLTLFELLEVITDLCTEEIDSIRVADLESRVHKALVLIEKDFPLSMQVIVFHLLHHLPMFLRRFGPVYGFWMYPYERFNSWITRRVTSRRYPEATVVEKYRLSEWAHFMELSGQLPDGATTTNTSVLDNLDVSPEDSSSDGFYELADEQVDQLEKIYCANSRTEENQECEAPHVSRMAIARKQLTYMDLHKRTIRLNTAEIENEHSFTRCSYVSTSGTNGIRVGRIISLFDHAYSAHTSTFAYVSWFEGPFVEEDSKLWFVDTTVQSQFVIPVTSLSKPLVTAFDEEEPGKLWILNIIL